MLADLHWPKQVTAADPSLRGGKALVGYMAERDKTWWGEESERLELSWWCMVLVAISLEDVFCPHGSRLPHTNVAGCPQCCSLRGVGPSVPVLSFLLMFEGLGGNGLQGRS